jgi:hypothetical protein
MRNPVNKAHFAEQVHKKTEEAVVWLFKDSGVSSIYDIPTLKADANVDGIKIATLCLLARFYNDNFELNAKYRVQRFRAFLKHYSQEAVTQILTRWQQKKQRLRAQNALYARVKSRSKKVGGMMLNYTGKTMRRGIQKTSRLAHRGMKRITAAPADFDKAFRVGVDKSRKYMKGKVPKVNFRKLADMFRYAVMSSR